MRRLFLTLSVVAALGSTGVSSLARAEESETAIQYAPTRDKLEYFHRARIEPRASWTQGSTSSPVLDQAQIDLKSSGNFESPTSPMTFGWSGWLETETLGAKPGIRGDVTELWLGFTPGGSKSRPRWVLGRIHPWALSQNPELDRPWGYLAQTELRSTSLSLGTAQNAEYSMQSKPDLVGWTGLHYWSNTARARDFQWGFSFTPFTEREPLGSNSGAFRPAIPTELAWEGQRIPLTVTNSSSLEARRFLVEPQVVLTARVQTIESIPFWSGWLQGGRTAVTDPVWKANPVITTSTGDLHASSSIDPNYPANWNVSLIQVFRPTREGRVFVTTRYVADNGTFGIEAGVGGATWSASFQNEWIPTNNQIVSLSPTPYSEMLAQVSWIQPWGERFATLVEARSHFLQGDLWLRTGAQFRVGKGISIDAGVDLFSGTDISYFGAWRAQDRVFVGINWDLKS